MLDIPLMATKNCSFRSEARSSVNFVCIAIHDLCKIDSIRTVHAMSIERASEKPDNEKRPEEGLPDVRKYY